MRDYDKEPLILQDYSGFPLMLHHLIILTFWITASGFCISYLDDFESGIFDPNQAKKTLIKFGFAIIIFLIFDCFLIAKSKKKYVYYYNSKIAYCDEKFKQISTENLLYSNGIVLKAIWFLDTIFTTFFW